MKSGQTKAWFEVHDLESLNLKETAYSGDLIERMFSEAEWKYLSEVSKEPINATIQEQHIVGYQPGIVEWKGNIAFCLYSRPNYSSTTSQKF